MTLNAGVWIDHVKAVVVLFTNEDEAMLQIRSDRDMAARSLGGVRVRNSSSRNEFESDDERERKAVTRFNKFYDDVITCLREADAILVLGPGEAKGEFLKRLQGRKLKGRVVHVGTVDRMTDRQIAVHVRQLIGLRS